MKELLVSYIIHLHEEHRKRQRAALHLYNMLFIFKKCNFAASKVKTFGVGFPVPETSLHFFVPTCIFGQIYRTEPVSGRKGVAYTCTSIGDVKKPQHFHNMLLQCIVHLFAIEFVSSYLQYLGLQG